MELPIVLIENDTRVAEELSDMLKNGGYEPIISETTNQADTFLKDRTIKAVLLSAQNNKDELLQFVLDLKANPATKWIPVIILSQSNNDEFRIDCFNKGVDDYLLFPINEKELLARIRGWLNRIGSFEELAFRDPLTKAYNRRYFDHQIMLEMQRAQRNSYPISVAFIDADKFKSINDTFGHHVGDLVLQGLSSTLQAMMRSSDIVARYGGEEFVILFPNANGEQACKRMELILEHVRKTPIAKHDNQERYITFSAGVAEWKPGMTVTDWVKSADDGVYAAKGQGRNRIILTEVGFEETETNVISKLKVNVVGNRVIATMIREEMADQPFELVEYTNQEEVEGQLVDICILTSAKVDKVNIEKFKKDKLVPNCKLILISESKTDYDLFQCLETGIDEYIRTPFSHIDIEIGLKRLITAM